MDDIYFWVRIFYFVWAFVLFLYMVYWGVTDLFLSSQCSGEHVPPENRWWGAAVLMGLFVLLYSLTEVVLKDVVGGSRVFIPGFFLFPASIACYFAASRVWHHKQSVKKGMCK